ncbi:MAG: hypothetical protein OQJ89_01860 [Kangiellaceae bacterium]|nr:hypothetical protein [Kangiellaceae bacterium]MCW8998577.1 hypothetical protein [Kangiellaceae bacterium]MCW9015689.1 hypothetical protein [Kangiellaceae bacterium]
MGSIFNFEKFAENLGKVCQCYCYQCSQKTTWKFGKLTEWARLFSFKTIPFRKEYFVFCEPCGDDHELDSYEFKRIESIVKSLGSIDDTNVKEELFNRIHKSQLENTCTSPQEWNQISDKEPS